VLSEEWAGYFKGGFLIKKDEFSLINDKTSPDKLRNNYQTAKIKLRNNL
jgi:hypothetical protein